jgi:hypothetical protein
LEKEMTKLNKLMNYYEEAVKVNGPRLISHTQAKGVSFLAITKMKRNGKKSPRVTQVCRVFVLATTPAAGNINVCFSGGSPNFICCM